MAPPPPRQPPELVADIIGEILLLLPPTDPASLVRASLVCKPWRRLLTDPSFHRRYCIFHSDGWPPPLLGFLYDLHIHGAVSTPRFVPTISPSPIPQPPALGYHDWSAIDCRHGRVLFDVCGYSINLIVWDPITGDHHELPEPPIRSSLYGAAVLCAAVCSGCDHLDCHGGPFLVILMALDDDTGSVMQAQMYSSETGAWNLSAHRDLRLHVARKPSTLIGDDIYFGLDSGIMMAAILRYDLGKNCLSTIDAPQWYVYEGEGGFVTLEMEDGSLGFAHISATDLHLWSRNANNTDVDDGWELWRTFDLAGPWIPNPCSQVCIVGSEEGAGVIFVSTDVGLFVVGLSSSGWIQKVSEPGHYDAVFPFMSFYTRLGW